MEQVRDEYGYSIEDTKEKAKDLQRKIIRQSKFNKQMALQVKAMRKREIEIVKRWDMDDIDLQTDRLQNLLMLEPPQVKKIKKVKSKVPELDFTKVYEIQIQQNEEYEEEEEEDEEDSNGK